MKKANEIKVNKEYAEQIRITLNRDFGYTFTYYNPIYTDYTYFVFKDTKTKNQAYRNLMMWYAGKYLAKFRSMIHK